MALLTLVFSDRLPGRPSAGIKHGPVHCDGATGRDHDPLAAIPRGGGSCRQEAGAEGVKQLKDGSGTNINRSATRLIFVSMAWVLRLSARRCHSVQNHGCLWFIGYSDTVVRLFVTFCLDTHHVWNFFGLRLGAERWSVEILKIRRLTGS